MRATMLSLAFVAMFASAPGQSFLISVFVDDMLEGTGLSRTAFSALYAGGTVVSALAMVGLGRATDRFGLRTAWALVAVGLAVACGVASLAQGAVLAFVALAVLRTFGQGSFPLLGTLIVARSFAGRRGRAMATASFGITAASITLPPLVVLLILEVGWRDAYRVLGLGVLVLVLPLAIFVRGRARGHEGEVVAAPPVEQFPPALRRSGLPTPRATRLLFVLAAPPLVMTAVIFHAVSLLGARGLSIQEAGLALSVFGAASAAGTIATGVIADRVTTRTLLTAMSGVLAGSLLLLLLSAAAAAYVAFVLLGLGGGLFGVASGIVWPRTYGIARIGRIQGTSFSVQISAAAIGPLPPAVSEAATDGYRPALVALAAYALFAAWVAFRWRDPRAVRARR